MTYPIILPPPFFSCKISQLYIFSQFQNFSELTNSKLLDINLWEVNLRSLFV